MVKSSQILGPKRQHFFLSGFGDPGHTFPLIALGVELKRRGHRVLLQTWQNWRGSVETEGLEFTPAPEYKVFPGQGRALKPYQAAVRAARQTSNAIEQFKADAVICDVITAAPGLAAELVGVPWFTVVPHVLPFNGRGLPPYGLGSRLPRTALGRGWWKTLQRPTNYGLRIGRNQLNGARRRLGLDANNYLFGGLSRELTIVATLPQLEYPRTWPSWAKVTGPLEWEPKTEATEVPKGDQPLVVVAPSTSKDREYRLLQAAVTGLEALPVRVLGSTNLKDGPIDFDTSERIQVVDWMSYSRVMPEADLIICHGGHGTLVKALSYGKPVIVAPVEGDMGENAARLLWSGAGTTLPWRFAKPWPLRQVVRRVLAEPRFTSKAQEIKQWCDVNDGASNAANLIEDHSSN